MDNNKVKTLLNKINISKDLIEKLHVGIAIFDINAKLIFANSSYKKMYHLEHYDKIDAKKFFLTAKQGIYRVLHTGEPNQCSSLSINGLYGMTYRIPLYDKEGELIGCMTENISVSSSQDKINKIQKIIEEINSCDDFSKTIKPKQSTKIITFDSIVGESPSMQLLKENGKRFAKGDEPILILGENGTGKDMVAQAIHAASQRHSGNFIAVNCAALPNELMESELFGYEPGAFTGAKSTGKEGLFEKADGGTIFLDEIGDLPLNLQAKLLRVLENHEIQKIGASKVRYIDFRLISATNRNLEKMVQQGLFREDLYYRLNLFDLVIPPLRERIEDIKILTNSILLDLLGKNAFNNIKISNDVFSIFSMYQWRGNVRELKNVLIYCLYSKNDDEYIISVKHLPERIVQTCQSEYVKFNKKESSNEITKTTNNKELYKKKSYIEKNIIIEAINKTNGNKINAAKLLGISRSTLYRKMHILDIN